MVITSDQDDEEENRVEAERVYEDPPDRCSSLRPLLGKLHPDQHDGAEDKDDVNTDVDAEQPSHAERPVDRIIQRLVRANHC